MAEAFFKTFEDFKQEWTELGKEFQAVFDSGNSPQDHDASDDDEEQLKCGIKRKLIETEDSIILTQKKMMKQVGFTQQRREEDPLLSLFRKENNDKFQELEKRTRTKLVAPQKQPRRLQEIDQLSHLKYNPTSPGFSLTFPKHSPASQGYTLMAPEYIPASPVCTPPVSPEYIPVSPVCTPPASPEYIPVSPVCTPPASPKYIPVSPVCTPPASPKYSPTSPELASPGYNQTLPVQDQFCQFLPTLDHLLTPLMPANLTETENSREYPLKEELRALCELIESIRVDFLQTSMLVKFIQDYLKNLK